MIRAAGAGDLETVRGLLREYGDSLDVDLSFQDFESEVAHFPNLIGYSDGTVKGE